MKQTDAAPGATLPGLGGYQGCGFREVCAARGAQGFRKRLRSASTSSLGGPSYGAGVCSKCGSAGPSAGAGAGAVAIPRHALPAAVSSSAAVPARERARLNTQSSGAAGLKIAKVIGQTCTAAADFCNYTEQCI